MGLFAMAKNRCFFILKILFYLMKYRLKRVMNKRRHTERNLGLPLIEALTCSNNFPKLVFGFIEFHLETQLFAIIQ